MMPDITPQRKEAFRDKAGQLGGLTFPCPTHHRRRDRSSIPLGCTAGVEVLESVFSAPGLGFVLKATRKGRKRNYFASSHSLSRRSVDHAMPSDTDCERSPSLCKACSCFFFRRLTRGQFRDMPIT